MRRATDAPFAGFLDEQIADGFLSRRVGCRRADLDAFGVGRRVREERSVDQTVVEDDVGHFEAGEPAHGDESGIARPGANQIDLGRGIGAKHTTSQVSASERDEKGKVGSGG